MLSRSESNASTLIDARLPEAPEGRPILFSPARLPGGRPRLFARFAIASTSHVRIGLASLTDTIFEGNGSERRTVTTAATGSAGGPGCLIGPGGVKKKKEDPR